MKNSQTYISWFTSDLERVKEIDESTFGKSSGELFLVISAVALFMYHWSIVLLAAIYSSWPCCGFVLQQN